MYSVLINRVQYNTLILYILAWRVRLGRIPCRAVLDKMGLDLDSTLCPRCLKEVETVNHALFRCEEVYKIWQAVARWWNMDIGRFETVNELLDCGGSSGESGSCPKLWIEMVWSVLYPLWSNRNRIVFEKCDRKVEDLMFDFQRISFEWIASRVRRKRIDWNVWIASPRLSLS